MKTLSTAITILLMAAVGFAAADSARLPEPVGTVPSDDDLTYFDGTAWWLSWDGLYRGTWFNTKDFYGHSYNISVEETEMWFWHHSSYPWDTSEVYFEVYKGNQMAPNELLEQRETTATHYSAVVVDHGSLYVEDSFWLMVNTELSSGGWPSILGDNSPNEVDHSFFSDDFSEWEPWVLQGPTANDYWIMATIGWSLESETWGSVKALY